MSAAKKGMLNVFYGILGQIITICFGILIPKLILDNYGSEVNGLLNTISQIFTYFSLLEAGIGVASLQALYTPVAEEDKTEIEAILVATHHFYKKVGMIYGLAVIVLAFIYPFFVVSSISYWTIFAIVLFGGIGNSINFFYQAKYKILMQAEGYSYVCTNITTIINILINIVKAALMIMGFNVLSVQISYFIFTILQMLIFSVYIKKHYSWINFSAKPNNVAISKKGATLVHQISGLVFNNTDILLLTLITKDLKIASVYSMYNLVITMATTMMQQIESGFSFRLGQMYNTNKERYYPLHHIFEILYMILIFSVMTCIYILLIPFIRLYTAGATDINYINKLYPLFFVITPLLTYGRAASLNVISYAGHFRETQNRAITETVINLLVSVVCIYKFGILGALLGTIVASLYRTNDMIIYAYKYLLPGSPWKTYKRWFACFGIFAFIVKFVNIDCSMFSTYPRIIGGAFILGIICLVVYTTLQIILNIKEFKVFISILSGYIGTHKKSID